MKQTWQITEDSAPLKRQKMSADENIRSVWTNEETETKTRG